MSKPGAYLKLDGNGAWWCDPQDSSGFGLKSQTPTPKSAQLASRAPARAARLPSFTQDDSWAICWENRRALLMVPH